MLDKSIPYKDLIMKWDGNRQCLLSSQKAW